jgi:oxygen-independent coproporphyrinogen-3 oxidase
MDSYVKALIKEIGLSTKKKISSVFLGGGTPSLLSANHLNMIFKKLNDVFVIQQGAEITLEANPGTLSKSFFKEIQAIGINRLSIGVQSFINSELKFLQRIHGSKTAEKSIIDARHAGFQNISLDLIFSIPGQTMESWNISLQKAIDLEIEHISCYNLTYEKGTPLYNMLKAGQLNKQNEDIDADMYEHTMQFLTESGFLHYEISNYAKPGKECRHNLNYWSGGTYKGFGSAAHSFDGKERCWNIKSVEKYIEMMNKQGNAITGKELLSAEDMLEENIFLSIRCGKLSMNEIADHISEKILNEIKKMQSYGYMTLEKDIIRLTPKGFLMADEIALRLISLISRP